MVSHCDSAFMVWNTLTSLEVQTTKYVEKEPMVDEFDETCYMVQENDSLEVHSDTHLDDSVNSSCDNNTIDAHALNEELSMSCENLLSKYKALKSNLCFLC